MDAGRALADEQLVGDLPFVRPVVTSARTSRSRGVSPNGSPMTGAGAFGTSSPVANEIRPRAANPSIARRIGSAPSSSVAAWADRSAPRWPTLDRPPRAGLGETPASVGQRVGPAVDGQLRDGVTPRLAAAAPGSGALRHRSSRAPLRLAHRRADSPSNVPAARACSIRSHDGSQPSRATATWRLSRPARPRSASSAVAAAPCAAATAGTGSGWMHPRLRARATTPRAPLPAFHARGSARPDPWYGTQN